MLEFALLVLLGLGVGAFGTLVGAGGGFVLVPILLLMYPERDAETITSMSLFVVWANATSGTLAYVRQRRVDYYSGIWFAIATLPGAVAGAIVVGFVPRRAFNAIFASVLIVLGLFLFLRSQSNAIRAPLQGRGVVQRRITDANGSTFAYSYRLWQGIVISAAVGFMSSLLGIGGGVVHVPVMATVLHFPVHIAAATSHFVLAFMALEGTGVHFATGALGWDQAFAQAVAIAVGAVPGAQVGARLSHRLHGGIIIRALAVALVLVGFRLGITAF